MITKTTKFKGRWQKDTDGTNGITDQDGKEYFYNNEIIKRRVNVTPQDSLIQITFDPTTNIITDFVKLS